MGGKQDEDEAYGESENKARAEPQDPQREGRPAWACSRGMMAGAGPEERS